MGMYKCETHGNQFALFFCEHAERAVSPRRPLEVFLQKGLYVWHTLCRACMLRPDFEVALDEADHGVCSKCVAEWANATGSDYMTRVKSPTNERP